MNRLLKSLFLLASIAASYNYHSPAAHASGRYGGTPTTAQNGNEMRMYVLGKEIFNGDRMGDGVQAAAVDNQDFSKELSALQSKLPPEVQGKSKLPELAGKIDKQQFEALQYYLAKRYKAVL